MAIYQHPPTISCGGAKMEAEKQWEMDGETQRNNKALLGTSLKDTYEMYPYRESHGTRALSRQECHMYMHYLYTTRERMQFPRTIVHVE
jgi:hypothetical protein